MTIIIIQLVDEPVLSHEITFPPHNILLHQSSFSTSALVTFVVGAQLCFIGYLAESLASTLQVPAATPPPKF